MKLFISADKSSSPTASELILEWG